MGRDQAGSIRGGRLCPPDGALCLPPTREPRSLRSPHPAPSPTPGGPVLGVPIFIPTSLLYSPHALFRVVRSLRKWMQFCLPVS